VIAAAAKAGRRPDGKLSAHVMVYFAMALAVFDDEDYEEVAARLTETLASWDAGISLGPRRPRAGSHRPASGWKPEPLKFLVDRVAVPVVGLLTRGQFLRDWRLMAIDGFELDVPDTAAR